MVGDIPLPFVGIVYKYYITTIQNMNRRIEFTELITIQLILVSLLNLSYPTITILDYVFIETSIIFLVLLSIKFIKRQQHAYKLCRLCKNA